MNSLSPKSYEEALRRKQAANARPRTPLKRGRIKPRKMSKPRTIEGDSERAIRDENDELIRKLLRLKESRCYTCQISWKPLLHPGHYITRKVFALRWHPIAVHLQCDACNEAHNT